MNLDPRTPVIVGVGQASERLGEPGYRRRSPVDLAADAAREALADAGGTTGAGGGGERLAAAIDTVAGIRQFENSVPGARAPLGRSDNYPRSVAGRVGANPARAVLEVSIEELVDVCCRWRLRCYRGQDAQPREPGQEYTISGGHSSS